MLGHPRCDDGDDDCEEQSFFFSFPSSSMGWDCSSSADGGSLFRCFGLMQATEKLFGYGQRKSKQQQQKKKKKMQGWTAALSFLSTFEDVYKLWVFASRFLDANYVSKQLGGHKF